MKHSATLPGFLWHSCAAPSAAWFLVWMAPALLLLDSDATLGSAMIRLLAVLMVAALIWARGLGPRGELADRLFVAAWAASWAAALGALVTSGAWTSSPSSSAALLAALFVGGGWLGWAFHQRHELLRQRGNPGELSELVLRTPASPSSVLAAWLSAPSLLLLLGWSKGAHWTEGIALLIGLCCFTAFQKIPAADDEARAEGAAPDAVERP